MWRVWRGVEECEGSPTLLHTTHNPTHFPPQSPLLPHTLFHTYSYYPTLPTPPPHLNTLSYSSPTFSHSFHIPPKVDLTP